VLGLARRHRLLTLTGPGGCGKTRLGLEAAASLLRDAADGVWLVELAGLSDGALVAPAVGAVLGVGSRSTRPSEQAIAAHVGEAQMLVVLDNCEHLVVACPRLVEGLLTHCPNLRILATSREPLHIAGEVDWRVPSLGPREATQLFADRATAVSSRFVLSEENADAVADVWGSTGSRWRLSWRPHVSASSHRRKSPSGCAIRLACSRRVGVLP
jgi:predicted ATPase